MTYESQAPEGGERAAFEVWARSNHLIGSSGRLSPSGQIAWDAWQARAALAAQPESDPADVLAAGSAEAYHAALAAQPQAPVALTDAQLEHEWRHFNAPVDSPISLFDFECVAIVVQEALGIRAPQTKEPTNDR